MQGVVILLCQQKIVTKTHYHDKSYHSCFEHIATKLSNWNQSGAFTFHVDAGERCALAKPGRHVSGAESDWPVEQGHTQSLGGLSQRGMENI